MELRRNVFRSGKMKWAELENWQALFFSGLLFLRSPCRPVFFTSLPTLGMWHHTLKGDPYSEVMGL
jgi:hypothetical protein